MAKLTNAQKLVYYRKALAQYERTNDTKLEVQRRMIAHCEAEIAKGKE